MAERRMFSKTIIDSDVFMDMPLSTQALYFHLSIRADDDGFINNSKKILRMVGASDDDFKILVAKKFIIVFESGICVIRHWLVHNYIKKDRYKPTIFSDEIASLITDDNKVYYESKDVGTTMEPVWNRFGTTGKDRLGQDRIDKDRLGQDRLGEERSDKVSNQESHSVSQSVAELFNEVCISFPRVIDIDKKRETEITELVDKYGVDKIRECFEIAERSSFLKGKNGRRWKADFDWIISHDKFIKILEHRYDDKYDISEQSELEMVTWKKLNNN